MSALEPTPSFSLARKWSISLNVLVSSLTVLALVLMVNYLAARHFKRFSLSESAQIQLSPLTLRVLGSLTNDVKVIVYFDKREPLYDSIWALLKEYSSRNSRIKLEAVDYERDPGLANVIKATYKLSKLTEKDLIIFDCKGKGTKVVYEAELSDIDVQPMLNGQGPPRRSHFKGELMFTSAIFTVTSGAPLKAFFLTDHKEHPIKNNDADVGYGRFAELLRQNNIEAAELSLMGTNDIPGGNLLVIAGAIKTFSAAELAKIDQYLKNGGRMLVLFNLFSADKTTGLEKILADWGVEVGNNVVRDKDNSTSGGHDVASSAFGNHPTVNPLFQTRVDLVEPRSIRKAPGAPVNADSANVAELVFSGPRASIVTDLRNGVPYPQSAELRTNVCLAVAVEKGKIRNVSADRGTTRIVAVGDSYFWDNQMIDLYGNRDFASLAVNWLLDRSELLAIQRHPIKEYKLTMTKAQLKTVIWLMLAGMPGGVLIMGFLVWARRRK